MDSKALTQIWTAIGVVLVFLTVDTWLLTQGGTALFSAPVLDKRPVCASYYGVLSIAPLLIALSKIGRTFAARSRADAWHARIPVVGLEGVDTASKEGRRYQCFFLLAFTVLPLFSLVHFNDKVFNVGRVAKVAKEQPLELDLSPFRYVPSAGEFLTFRVLGNDYCLGQNLSAFDRDKAKTSDPCHRTAKWAGGVTWFPVISPLAVLALTAWACVSVGSFLAVLFRRAR